MKKERPFAKCTKCGTATANSVLINQRCPLVFKKRSGNKFKPERCRGIYRSMLLINDWKECPDCRGDGCDACRDAG